MATREELQQALLHLQDAPSFGRYVKTLESRRDAVISQCLNAATSELAEPLRMEARALSSIIFDIEKNLPQASKHK
jgi:hypothetical protein